MAIDLRKLLLDRAAQGIGTGGGLLGNQTTGGLLGGLQNINPNLLIAADIIGSGMRGVDPFSSVLPAVTKTAQISKYLTPKVSKPSTYINKETGLAELVTPEKYAANPDLYVPVPPTKMFETAEEKEIGQVAGQEFKNITEAASNALNNNQNLDLMMELVSLPDIKTGFAGEFRTSIAGVAKEFGIETDIQNLTAAETLSGISGKLVLDGLSNFKGAISDSERQFLKEITPGLLNSIEGNKLLIEIGKRTNNLGIELSNQASNWVKENGGLSKKNAKGQSWEEFKTAFHKSNPVLNPELKDQIVGISKKIEPDFENNIITAKSGKKYKKIGDKYYEIK